MKELEENNYIVKYIEKPIQATKLIEIVTVPIRKMRQIDNGHLSILSK